MVTVILMAVQLLFFVLFISDSQLFLLRLPLNMVIMCEVNKFTFILKEIQFEECVGIFFEDFMDVCVKLRSI